MDSTCSEQLIRRFVAGDATAIAALVQRSARAAQRSATSSDPAVLVATALAIPPRWRPLLAHAAEAATGTRERQLVVIAAAHLAGDGDRAHLLALDHGS
ncbi:hypothetical protein [Pseudonocardia sp. GCM10023141]|uniref:hypothetical protein n=1 Tax=Pseudonocardia sp. GCM10023141 TaxID=3252653 RepID=UPI00360FF00C